MTHFSLFTGIGGLDLAAEWAGFKTVGQCEWADYPTKVLEKHWPDVPKWRDIHDLRGADISNKCGKITVISGGFPCQPHSVAGKRKASADERDLWPEYRRVISEVRPKWVVAENVPGLLSSEDGRFFRGILRDFTEMGFNVGWCCYPAAWVGAIHRRERVFTIAYAVSNGLFSGQKGTQVARPEQQLSRFLQTSIKYDLSKLRSYREDNGIKNRIYRIKCLGNAVVPQQAYPIFKAIADIEMG